VSGIEGEKEIEREGKRGRNGGEGERGEKGERERERERGREGGKERIWKYTSCHVNVAIVRGSLTPIFVRAVGVVATFLLLLSNPSQSVPTKFLVGPLH
jgi:hypothetical protein